MSVQGGVNMVTSIIDKVALWMLCMLSIILFGITTQFVFVTLLVTIIVGLEITEKMNEKTLEFIIIVYTILCIVLMEGVGFVPLFTYIARRYRMNLALFCFVPVSFYIGFQSLYGVSGWLAPLGLIIPLVTIFSVIAWTLEVRTKQYLEIEGRYRELRDNATERNRRLHDENTQLIERQDYEVHLATLQERNRIAREIHDHVGHMLTRGILQVGALQAANKSADLQAPIDSIQETLNIAMTNIRTSVHDLHDESIDLKTAIDEMLSRFPSYSFFFQYDIKQDVKKEIKRSEERRVGKRVLRLV